MYNVYACRTPIGLGHYFLIKLDTKTVIEFSFDKSREIDLLGQFTFSVYILWCTLLGRTAAEKYLMPVGERVPNCLYITVISACLTTD